MLNQQKLNLDTSSDMIRNDQMTLNIFEVGISLIFQNPCSVDKCILIFSPCILLYTRGKSFWGGGVCYLFS